MRDFADKTSGFEAVGSHLTMVVPVKEIWPFWQESLCGLSMENMFFKKNSRF